MLFFAGHWLSKVAKIRHPEPIKAPVAPAPAASPANNPVAPASVASPVNTYQPYAPVNAKPDEATELKRYRDMLNEGLITQEDYDAKKKEILGL